MRTVLILGGTGEARRLAAALTGLRVVSSLAGRVAQPSLPPGEVRVGGFGGVAGLVDYLRAERVSAIVDATHPFAARITSNAAAAAVETGVPLLVLRRPGWTLGPGDRWQRVPSLDAAAEAVRDTARVFLTTGRQSLPAFAHLTAPWFLSRSVDPPEPPLPPRLEVLLDRGPFTVEAETTLLRDRAIDVLVTKDSGGDMTSAKLTAARALGLPVVMVDRPPLPAAVEVTSTVPEILTRLDALMDFRIR
ncbi:cobalt-precorrin-6A reductase [Dactylosporangium sp. AC04546]|uniref:cobalt-precorrin-6A reductase n=1 Tax=Dactylosporangium sp. AC04546 TaxID=2862460 RepID=UPI001EDCAF64|nr:cobalt-precorrin-6A reductase [Dactylosporangium sp. AC04546]WVK86129.1 cobalt-precorrin-6A reductase [Dactylosporangium sp. AC04546]